MAGEPGGRKLLPQNSQMPNFSFAPTNTGPRENQKSASSSCIILPVKSNLALDYVFVDEHNRHKRLKGRNLPLLDRSPADIRL
jgi:hypothetical protein